MKKYIISLLVSALVFFVSCNHERAEKPIAKFNIYQKDSNGISHVVDTMVFNSYVDIKFEGPKCDRVVYFTGPATYNISKKSSTGFAADIHGHLLNTKINRQGLGVYPDTVHCIATNLGEWGTEILQDTAFKIIFIDKATYEANLSK